MPVQLDYAQPTKADNVNRRQLGYGFGWVSFLGMLYVASFSAYQAMLLRRGGFRYPDHERQVLYQFAPMMAGFGVAALLLCWRLGQGVRLCLIGLCLVA